MTDSTPLAGVRVTVVGERIPAVSAPSTVTAADGSFTLLRIPVTGVRLSLFRTRVAPDTVAVPDSVVTLTVYVLVVPVELPPVVITAMERPIARERFEAEAQPSTVSLTAADIQRVPAILEADVVRMVQYLPGSVAKNDYSIGYNVRGGESDQNLIQLDGIPIFNPSHLAGLFSTFDANAVSRTDFYSGGFPSEYSGRLSSVLDIGLRTGNPERIGVNGEVSLLSSKLLVEGPAGRATWLVSGRRTYVDALVSLLSKEVLPYYFTDLVGKVTLPYGRRGSVGVTGYWGRDVLDLEIVKAAPNRDAQRLAFDWGNGLFGISWQQPLGATALLESRAGVSTFSTALGLRPSLVEFTNDARLYTAQTVFSPAPGARHDVRLGGAVESYAMNYGIGSLALETNLFEAHYAPTVWSAFAEDQWRAARWLLLRPGARLDYVTGTGATVVSPRVSFKTFLSSNDAIQGSVGRYHQAIHSIRDQEIPVTIFEFWIGADQYVPVGRADHFVLGYERWFGRNIQLTVEAYRKQFANLVTPNPAQDLRVVGDEFIPADGDAWGGDILLRKHAGALRGWIAYGYTRTVRRAQGMEFPPAHDRRHTLNVIAFAPGPLGSDLGVRFGVGSPLPYTGWIGEWEHPLYDAINHRFGESDREPISSTINGQRYPTYTRLDVSFRWQFEKWGGQWEPYVQVANM
ncbi:MAG: TonB-dependent receptor, partial [Gemmatimonadota bacterium]|nr:TonB-dependent receptor [Gemmatimonadota bacterium]